MNVVIVVIDPCMIVTYLSQRTADYTELELLTLIQQFVLFQIK